MFASNFAVQQLKLRIDVKEETAERQRNFVRCAIAAISCAFVTLCAQQGFAVTINVSNASQLQSALSSANGGDQIVLASGNYGSVTVSNRVYNSYVIVRSSNPSNRAVLNSLTVVDSRHLEFSDLHVSRSDNLESAFVVHIDNSDDVRVVNCEINGKVDNIYSGPRYGVHINNGSNRVRIEGCNIHDLLRGTFALSAFNVEYYENFFDYFGYDALDFSSCNGLLIENNEFGGHHIRQPGAHMDFIQGSGGNTSNLTIRGNVLIARGAADIQGIFLGDVVYTNVLIEQNVIYTGMGHGIRVDAGSNVVVRHNTVLHADGTTSSGTSISGPSGMVKSGNIYVNWQDDPNNLVLPQQNLNDTYATLFQNPVTTALNENHNIFNFIPKPGSEADDPNVGAWHRINELTGFAGGNQPPTVSVITQNPADMVTGSPGSQILEGTTVFYSGSASDSNGDPLTWQWRYKINGGAEVLHSSGSGTVTDAQFTYGNGTAGRTYEWILRVNDGTVSIQASTLTEIVSESTPSDPTGQVLGWDQIEAGTGKTPIIWLAEPQPEAVSFYVRGVWVRTDDTGPGDGGSNQFQVWPPVTLQAGDEIRAEWGSGQSHTVFAVAGQFPEIALYGLNPAKVYVGGTYIDAGATAHDFQDGNITPDISMTSNVNTAIPGEYTVTYNVMDSQSNPAVPVYRIVRVVGSQFNVKYLWEEGETLQVTVPTLEAQPMQWWKGTVPLMDNMRIDGADSDSLMISPLQVSDTGTYSVQLADSKGVVSLGSFTIKVLPAGSLPASGTPLLIVLAATLIVLGAFAIRRLIAQ